MVCIMNYIVGIYNDILLYIQFQVKTFVIKSDENAVMDVQCVTDVKCTKCRAEVENGNCCQE